MVVGKWWGRPRWCRPTFSPVRWQRGPLVMVGRGLHICRCGRLRAGTTLIVSTIRAGGDPKKIEVAAQRRRRRRVGSDSSGNSSSGNRGGGAPRSAPPKRASFAPRSRVDHRWRPCLCPNVDGGRSRGGGVWRQRSAQAAVASPSPRRRHRQRRRGRCVLGWRRRDKRGGAGGGGTRGTAGGRGQCSRWEHPARWPLTALGLVKAVGKKGYEREAIRLIVASAHTKGWQMHVAASDSGGTSPPAQVGDRHRRFRQRPIHQRHDGEGQPGITDRRLPTSPPTRPRRQWLESPPANRR